MRFAGLLNKLASVLKVSFEYVKGCINSSQPSAGYVTHATDRVLWCYREPSLSDKQRKVARNWLERVKEETLRVEQGITKSVREALTLREDQTIGWDDDKRYEEIMRLVPAVSSEGWLLSRY